MSTFLFDRGSRGNPGPGGAVVVRVTSDNVHAEVIFSADMTYGDPTTTNNQAEYNGLITGHTTATENNWMPLSVSGDSMLIVRQMRTYTPPLYDKLRVKYAQAADSPIPSESAAGVTSPAQPIKWPTQQPTSPWTTPPVVRRTNRLAMSDTSTS